MFMKNQMKNEKTNDLKENDFNSTIQDVGENHLEIIQLLTSLKEEVTSINEFTNSCRDKMEFDEQKQEFIENLFSNTQRYKDDFFFDIIKPLIISVIRFKDGLDKDISNFELHTNGKEFDDETLRFIDIFKGATQDVTDILELYDVVAYKCNEDKFNPLKQIAVKTVPTTDEALFKTVHESLSYGYERNGYVISKEKVSVFAVQSN